MDELDDIELLRGFVEHHSDAHFATLVRRQIDLVYSAALRQMRSPHAAEEVTQAVFVVLARKAASLLRFRTLTGWLYQATRLTAANYLRTESRRARREQEAYMQLFINEPAESSDEVAWMQTAPLLESAMGELSSGDRDAVLLRFFENKSLRDVGLELGVREDAARMRVNRALEKLRRFLTRRDVSLSATALAGVLATKSVQAAPLKLASSVAAAVSQGIIPGSSVAVLAKGTLNILAWARYKIMLSLGASAVLVAAVVTTAVLSPSKAAAPPRTRSGPIAQLAPFQGSASEGFDAVGTEVTRQGISILGGMATVSNLTQRGALKLVSASSMGGVPVTAHSPSFMLGQLGVSEWVFSAPLSKFGAYFANNSRFDDAKVDFYDVNDALITSQTARVPKGLRGWTWNGWQSEVPIHRLVITGNDAGFMHGFIWFDDVQVDKAPEPVVRRDRSFLTRRLTRSLLVLWRNGPGTAGTLSRNFIPSLPGTIHSLTNFAVCNDPGQGGAVVRFRVPVTTNSAAMGIDCVPPSGSFFPVGTNFVRCTATNETGQVLNTCGFEITVHDCEPPVIHSIAASPEVLWPPNHRMEEVRVRVEASDNCHVARCRIISVSCSESIIGSSSVQTTAGWEITGDLTVNLSAERSSVGTGRDYSITVECRDDSGNASTAVVHVTVPVDLRQQTAPLRSAPDKTQYAALTDMGGT